jgi:hypothetical protein
VVLEDLLGYKFRTLDLVYRLVLSPKSPPPNQYELAAYRVSLAACRYEALVIN